MGYLHQIDVENFKSWRGKHVIGPFKRFTCIVGTNGSGKSNLIDALSFAMGERASLLRVMHQKDLIHGSHIGRPVSDSACVALRYRDDSEYESVFSRRISGDSSEYHINGVHVTLSKYLEELGKIGIVTKAQNCLVFQGAVESIAVTNPRERTKMFELISESMDFAAEYGRKKEAMQKAREDTHYQFKKKKIALCEKNQMSQETKEAQSYQMLVDDVQQKRLQLNLAELYYNEKTIGTLSSTLTDKQQAVEDHKHTLVDWEQSVKTLKKEHGRLSREQQHIEKEIRSQEKVLTQCQAQYVQAKVNTSHRIKKAEEVVNAIKRRQEVIALKEQELADIRQEKAELKRTWSIYEKQIQQQRWRQERDIELDEGQLERYKELKELARKQGAALIQQVEKLQWEVRADHAKMDLDQRRRKDVESGIKNQRTYLEDLTCRAKKLEEFTNTCKSSILEYEQLEKTVSAELERGRQRSAKVNTQLGQVLEQLRNARLDSQDSRRQVQRREQLEKLHRLHPEAVLGRLCDLCSPIHKKYQLAVTKVFGHFLKAIVVTSEKVARCCIVSLKDERAEPETFLPLDYIHVPPVSQRLRDVPGAKLLVDVVQVSAAPGAAQLRKAVHFVCGNTLVCETTQEAKSLAFDGKERCQTVSLEGTLFTRSGVISGGSSDLQTKARCWDEKDVTLLTERKDQLAAELRELMKLRRKEADLKQIGAESRGARTRLKYTNTELENLRKKNIRKCQADISRMESELMNVDSQILTQQGALEAADAEMSKIRDQINQIDDLVFTDFCAEIGVGSIREYEQGQLKEQAEHQKKRMEFDTQCTHLNTKLEYEEEQLEKQRKKIQSMKEAVDKVERTVAEQKEEKRQLDAVEEEEKKLLELNNQLQSKKRQVLAAKSELDQKIQRLKDTDTELVKLQREVMTAETALEQKHVTRHNVLLACKIQNLPITLLSGSLDDISEVQLDTESESTLTTVDICEREAQLVIDYSGLEVEIRNAPAEEVEDQLEKLKQLVSSVEDVLHGTWTPNLKAVEKMGEVNDKFLEVAEAFDASTRVTQKCSREFEQVKTLRYRRFIQCFDHVSVVIDQIYKRICSNSSAQAFLRPENPEEPYLGGIIYDCIAPGKRFMPMDNLSGGEKAIAALALLFAIHSFRPAPFFVLDEMDASLDNSNIGKVTSFIREETRENMQIIVISHKEEFYSKADALVGVYSGFDECMFSSILTLDLSLYPLTEEASGTWSEEESRDQS